MPTRMIRRSGRAIANSTRLCPRSLFLSTGTIEGNVRTHARIRRLPNLTESIRVFPYSDRWWRSTGRSRHFARRSALDALGPRLTARGETAVCAGAHARRTMRDMRLRARDDAGQAMIFVAIAAVVLLGALALAVDWGYGLAQRRVMQTSSDAAALAVGRLLATSVQGVEG